MSQIDSESVSYSWRVVGDFYGEERVYSSWLGTRREAEEWIARNTADGRVFSLQERIVKTTIINRAGLPPVDGHRENGMSETFGFRVARAESETHPGWCVSLPHQCDSWDIAGEDGYYGVTHAEAVAQLERFIAEAQAALASLFGELPHGE